MVCFAVLSVLSAWAGRRGEAEYMLPLKKNQPARIPPVRICVAGELSAFANAFVYLDSLLAL